MSHKKFKPGENRDLDEYLAERIPIDVAIIMGQPDAEFAEQVLLGNRWAVRAFIHEGEAYFRSAQKLTEDVMHVRCTCGLIEWVRKCV